MPMIRMSAPMIFSRMPGHSSPSPMSDSTPKGMLWSTTRISSQSTSRDPSTSITLSISASVFETSGDFLSVQLSRTAFRRIGDSSRWLMPPSPDLPAGVTAPAALGPDEDRGPERDGPQQPAGFARGDPHAAEADRLTDARGVLGRVDGQAVPARPVGRESRLV